MYLDPKSKIAGKPALEVRDFLKKMDDLRWSLVQLAARAAGRPASSGAAGRRYRSLSAAMHGTGIGRRKLSTRAILLSGAGAAAIVIATTMLSWDELVMRYHVSKLHHDPTLFPTYLHEPKGAPRHRAMEEFVQTPRGRDAFAAEFEQAVIKRILSKTLRRSLLQSAIWLGDGYASYFHWGRNFMGRYGIQLRPVTAEHLAALKAVLPLLDGETFLLDGYDNLTFTIRSSAAASLELAGPFLRELGDRMPKDTMLCIIRATPKASVPILIGLLSGSFTTARMDAADALAQLGPIARDAIPALEEQLEDPKLEIFPDIAEAFRKAIATIRTE